MSRTMTRDATNHAKALKVYWIRDGALYYRVWRNDWFGDQFERMEHQDFKRVERVCRMLSIPFEEHFDEDDQH